MGRYTGPAERLSRREGVELELKGLRRLDNVIFRLGFATTRAQARQFVSHGHVTVDGRRVTIPSFRVRPGQVVGLRDISPVRPVAAESAELLARVAPWLETDPDALVGRVLRGPTREDVHLPVDEQLVVEHFSRR